MINFGKIKNAYNSLLAESIGKKHSINKDLFSKYVKIIKESDILKTQFLVYTNIENKLEEDTHAAFNYVNENVALLRKFNYKDIIKENTKLVGLAKEVTNKLNKVYNYSELHSSLANLICINKTASNIEKLNEETKKIVDFIKTNKPKEIIETVDLTVLPSSMLTTIMVDKFNERYDNLSENERKVLKALIEDDKGYQKDVFKQLTTECIDLVNESLKAANIDTKEQLLKVKEKILNDRDVISESELVSNISNLLELKETLQNNNI